MPRETWAYATKNKVEQLAETDSKLVPNPPQLVVLTATSRTGDTIELPIVSLAKGPGRGDKRSKKDVNTSLQDALFPLLQEGDVLYEPAVLTKFAELKSLAKTTKGTENVLSIDDYRLLSVAMEWTSSKFAFMSVPKNWSTNESIDQLDKTTSPGYPLTAIGLLKQSDALEYASLGLHEYARVFSSPSVVANSVKDELRDEERVKAEKTRTFMAANISSKVEGNYLFGAQNEAFYALGSTLDYPHTVGFSEFKGGWDRLVRKFDGKLCLSFDEAGYDASLTPLLMSIVGHIRAGYQHSSVLAAETIKYYTSMIYGLVKINSTGHIFQKYGGNPSGSVNTIVDNTLALYVAIVFTYLKLTPISYHSEELFDQHITLALCGDDNVWGFSEEIRPYFSVESIQASLSVLSITATLESDPFVPFRDLVYLSTRTITTTYGIYAPLHDGPRMLQSMCYPARKLTAHEMFSRALEMRRYLAFHPLLEKIDKALELFIEKATPTIKKIAEKEMFSISHLQKDVLGLQSAPQGPPYKLAPPRPPVDWTYIRNFPNERRDSVVEGSKPVNYMVGFNLYTNFAPFREQSEHRRVWYNARCQDCDVEFNEWLDRHSPEDLGDDETMTVVYPDHWTYLNGDRIACSKKCVGNWCNSTLALLLYAVARRADWDYAWLMELEAHWLWDVEVIDWEHIEGGCQSHVLFSPNLRQTPRENGFLIGAWVKQRSLRSMLHVGAPEMLYNFFSVILWFHRVDNFDDRKCWFSKIVFNYEIRFKDGISLSLPFMPCADGGFCLEDGACVDFKFEDHDILCCDRPKEVEHWTYYKDPVTGQAKHILHDPVKNPLRGIPFDAIPRERLLFPLDITYTVKTELQLESRAPPTLKKGVYTLADLEGGMTTIPKPLTDCGVALNECAIKTIMKRSQLQEKMKNLLGKSGFSESEIQYMIYHLDPNHDFPLEVSGPPTTEIRFTTGARYRKAINIDLSSITAGSTADILIFSTQQEWTSVTSVTSADSLSGNASSLSASNPSGVPDYAKLSGVIVCVADSGQQLLPPVNSFVAWVPHSSWRMFNIPLVDTKTPNVLKSNVAYIGKAIEVIDGTAALDKQGFVYSARLPSMNNSGVYKKMAASVTDLAEWYGDMLPPATASDLELVPNHTKWESALDGIYMPLYNSRTEDSYHQLSYEFCRFFISDPGVNDMTLLPAFGTNPGNILSSRSCFQQGVIGYFGVKKTANINVAATWVIDTAPGIDDSELLVRSKPSTTWNPMVFELLARISHELPTAFFAHENSDGSMFSKIFDVAKKVLTSTPVMTIGKSLLGALVGPNHNGNQQVKSPTQTIIKYLPAPKQISPPIASGKKKKGKKSGSVKKNGSKKRG